jgi:hypothetical protein
MLVQLLPSLRRLSPNVPDKVWAEVEKEFSSEIQSGGVAALVIPIYDKYFSEDEIRQLLSFYESPIGKKLAETMPRIAAESFTVGQEWGMEIWQKMRAKLKARGYST